jgi:sulfur-oxidizing protein SoxY
MKPSRSNRRRVLGMMAVAALGGRLHGAAAADADPVSALIRDLVGASPLREGRIRLTIPELADTGHSVPVTIDVDSPMTANDFVKSIHLIAPRNPRPLAASVFLSPLSGRASFATRMRLAGEQEVVAIAKLSDGSHCLARANVVVTVSSCIDGT